jgi:hypothetical protein
VSPHWLRHAHASHALDHGAPIHLVRATLGHGSVATTSAYLHARPEDSSARFLRLERFSAESSRFCLPLLPARVMNVTTAKYKRLKEKSTMATFTIDAENNIAAHAGTPARADNLQAFSCEKDLEKLAADWPAFRLIEVWNSFAGVAPFDDLKPVKKFTSRQVAVSRIWQAVARLSPDGAPQARDAAPAKGRSKKSPTKAKRRDMARKGAIDARTNKKAEVIAMMKRAKGATLTEIAGATGWQRHTVRGFVSILGSKGGEKIESSRNDAGERVYRIAK